METLGAEAVTAVLHQTIPAVARLGITVDSVGPGEVTLRVPIEGNANHFGTLYAAALVAVAELAIARDGRVVSSKITAPRRPRTTTSVSSLVGSRCRCGGMYDPGSIALSNRCAASCSDR